MALLSSGALTSKSSQVRNQGLVAEAYEWDKEEVSSDDNEMVDVKVLMKLVDDESGVVGKESVINGEWVKIPMRKVQTLLEMEDNDERKYFLDYLGVDLNFVEEQRNNHMQKDLVFVKSSANDTKVSIPNVKRLWLSKAKGFNLPNHDTGIIVSSKLNVEITDPSATLIVTDSSVTIYDSAEESSLVCSIPLPPLEKLADVEPASGSKTIKSILKFNSTFKAETLKGVTINEPTNLSAPTKGNKNVSASKKNSAPAGKLKNVKTEDDIPLSM
ncbi:hypothetical protein Tco_0025603 [Tanacetum coccineum]